MESKLTCFTETELKVLANMIGDTFRTLHDKFVIDGQDFAEHSASGMGHGYDIYRNRADAQFAWDCAAKCAKNVAIFRPHPYLYLSDEAPAFQVRHETLRHLLNIADIVKGALEQKKREWDEEMRKKDEEAKTITDRARKAVSTELAAPTTN